jgi:hypothetical protein
MNLMGLSPEQITDLGKLGQGQQDLMVRAATALAQKQESAANREAQFRTIGISVDGQDYEIDARDFPNMWGKIQEAERANDTELFTMHNGQRVAVPRDQMSQFINAQANMLQLPSQIARQTAETGKLYGETEETFQLMKPRADLMRGQASYYGQLADTGKTEAERNRMTMAGIEALRGVGVEDWSKPKHAAEVMAANPGTASTMVQASAVDTEMNHAQRRLAEDALVTLGWQIMNPGAGQKVSPTEIESFNRQAGIMKMPYAMALDHKGKGMQVRMPIINGQQFDAGMMTDMLQKKGLTIQSAIDFARERNINPDEMFKRIAEESFRTP